MAIDGGKIIAFLELDTSGYGSAMQGAKSYMDDLGNGSLTMGQKVTSAGKMLGGIGNALTMGVTTPILSAAVASTKAAIDFESAFAGVRKTVDASEAEYQALSDSIIDMSGRIPQSANELAGIMEIAGQLGVDKDNLTSFTETIANLGVATNLSGEEAATMLAQYANIMKMPLGQIGNLGSVIVDLGNSCATTEKDITEMAQRLAGTGNLLGLSNAQVLGLSATMASLGINAEAGGSAMSRTLQTINTAVLEGGDDLQTFAQISGMSAKSFADGWKADPLTALETFLLGVGNIKAQGGDAAAALGALGLTDLRITDTLLRMSGAQGALSKNISQANRAWSENNALNQEAEKRYATTESQLQMAKNSIVNAGAALGETFLPFVGKAAQGVTQAAQSFSAMDGQTQSMVMGIAGMAAAAGPTLKVLGSMLTLVSNPVGLTVALAGLGAAGVGALVGMDRAVTKAALSKRFGEVTLSAEEMDNVIKAVFSNHDTTGIDGVSKAAEQVNTAVTDMQASAKNLDKMIVKAEMGVDVDQEATMAAVSKAREDLQKAIDAQAMQATMAVKAVFGSDDPEGTQLASDFSDYFSGLESEATALGSQLARAINTALADGIIDEDESVTIEALQMKMQQMQNAVANLDIQQDLFRLKMDARNIELSPETLKELGAKFQAEMERQMTSELQAREMLLNYSARIAAYSSDDKYDEAWYAQQAQTINDRYERNLAQWQSESYIAYWDSVGSRVTGRFATEMDTVGQLLETQLPQVIQSASIKAEREAKAAGYKVGDEYWDGAYGERFRDHLETGLDEMWDGMQLPDDVVRSAQTMYEMLAPDQKHLEHLAKVMGDDFPSELQDALGQIDMLQMLGFDTSGWADMISGYMTQEDLAPAAQEMTQPAVDTVSEASSSIASEGGNAAAGYASSLEAGSGAAASAARRLVQAALDAVRSAQDSHSPSREFGKLGGFATQGYTGGMDTGAAWRAGYAMTRAAVEGGAAGQDSHSPSRDWEKLAQMAGEGFIGTCFNNAGPMAAAGAFMTEYTLALAKKKQDEALKRAAAARAAAAAAEAQRQAAILKGIKTTGAATLAADNKIYGQRKTLLEKQTKSLLAFAGAHAIWYEDDKGQTESKAARGRYDALIAEENASYEKKKIQYKGHEDQLKALDEYHKKRLEALKKQQTEESDAIKKQYDLQKNIALDWLDSQSGLLQRQLDAQREAYAEDDYQAELAGLKKQQRQSKSARERRELQEEIDKMERDHALDMQQDALDVTLAGYDALRKAVEKGLIGLGDLTGDKSFGALSFGTAGIGALDNISELALENVLASLDRSALTGGTGATVSAAQMAAALTTAGGSVPAPVVVEKSGNTYNIDLQGCVVRDDSDIDQIVEKIEARIRAAGR